MLRVAFTSVALCSALLAPACLVDLDERCGDHQRYDAETEVCLCDEGYVRQGTGATATCEAASALGEACEMDSDCGEGYDYCALAEGADEGYCTTSGCKTEADCPTDYGCNTRVSPAFCEKPPEGLGTACSSAKDCAGFEASYCETVSAGACLVNDCAPDPDKCHGDWVCCDIGLLSQSLCIPPSELENGECPAGGQLVPRSE